MKREEGGSGDQENKGGNQKERDPASNQFPKCSPPSRTYKEIQSWVQNKSGREEIEATW